MSSLKQSGKAKMAVIVLIYLILSISYSIVVPIGRGADEWAHYWYAQFIAQTGRLPLSAEERETAGYKSDWPPLYHLLAAGITGWIETDGPPTFKYRADDVRRQLVPARGPEAILHTEDEAFPWQQEVLVWHLGRFLSIIFAAGTLVVTYFLALDVFGRVAGSKVTSSRVAGSVQILALVSVGLLAFNPRFIFTGMVFGYDSLTLLLATLFLWLAIRVVKGFYPRWDFWGLGMLAGLALTTKYLAALLPVEIGVVVWLSWRAGVVPSIRQAAIRVGQAALAYLIVVSGWVAYLLINFNEIETYGPVLGTLAPLIRGDGSDRTVEALFAWLSGGQAPPPVHIEKQLYTAWQILVELPITFWGNAIVEPYPLNWFVAVMTLVVFIAGGGWVIWWRRSASASGLSSRIFMLLVVHSILAVPFMIIRLFGARDALEAVQGRHILFLSGPAVAVLLVWGLWGVVRRVQGVRYQMLSRRVVYSFLLGVMLVGAVSQLIFMQQSYPPLLPVQTTPYTPGDFMAGQVKLDGRAELIDVVLSDEEKESLEVNMIWRVDEAPFKEDYVVELALVDAEGQLRAGWSAYQTQARFPTRAWETGDVVRDEGWLPLVGLSPGDYEIQMRILGQAGAVIDWLILDSYVLTQPVAKPDRSPVVWQRGVITHQPLFDERETIQLTGLDSVFSLVGPHGASYEPASVGDGWANYMVEPAWLPGNYTLPESERPLLIIAPSRRDFQMPAIAHPLEIDFAGKIKLLGYDLPARRVEPGAGLTVVLYWQALDWMGKEFVTFSRLLDNAQVAWGGRDRLARENYSTLYWAPGEIITDPFAVQVDPDAPAGVYNLDVGWYLEVDGRAQSLPILHPETGESTGRSSVAIGPIKVGAPPAGVTVTEAESQNSVTVSLGDTIVLLGFDAQQTPGSLDLAFYWQALAQPAADYTVFVHVRNEAGEVVAQKDSPPVGGAYPTSLWDSGEIIRDEVSVPLVGLESGKYEVVVGMYDFVSGERLGVESVPDNTVLLQILEVTR